MVRGFLIPVGFYVTLTTAENHLRAKDVEGVTNAKSATANQTGYSVARSTVFLREGIEHVTTL